MVWGKHLRQHIIGDYIADFVCLSNRLLIELDGGYHQLPQQQRNDAARTEWLEKNGFTVIRFSNDEVLKNIEYVLKVIKEKLND
jgi:very-short-patch-repair endonuclease